MKIRRDIFGGAALFLAVGCANVTPSTGGNDTTPVDSVTADTTVADTGSVVDTLSPADTNVADTNVADTNVADTNVADTNVADTNVADTNVADTNVADTNVAQDTAMADIAEPDTVIQTDVQPIDATPMDVAVADTMVPEDSTCTLLTIDTAPGEACDENMAAICDGEDPTSVAVICFQKQWSSMADLANVFPLGCNCQPAPEPCTYAKAFCAVPGFVGLDHLERPRRVVRSLRMAFA